MFFFRRQSVSFHIEITESERERQRNWHSFYQGINWINSELFSPLADSSTNLHANVNTLNVCGFFVEFLSSQFSPAMWLSLSHFTDPFLEALKASQSDKFSYCDNSCGNFSDPMTLFRLSRFNANFKKAKNERMKNIKNVRVSELNGCENQKRLKRFLIAEHNNYVLDANVCVHVVDFFLSILRLCGAKNNGY